MNYILQLLTDHKKWEALRSQARRGGAGGGGGGGPGKSSNPQSEQGEEDRVHHGSLSRASDENESPHNNGLLRDGDISNNQHDRTKRSLDSDPDSDPDPPRHGRGRHLLYATDPHSVLSDRGLSTARRKRSSNAHARTTRDALGTRNDMQTSRDDNNDDDTHLDMTSRDGSNVDMTSHVTGTSPKNKPNLTLGIFGCLECIRHSVYHKPGSKYKHHVEKEEHDTLHEVAHGLHFASVALLGFLVVEVRTWLKEKRNTCGTMQSWVLDLI